jgi:hypothetical protein
MAKKRRDIGTINYFIHMHKEGKSRKEIVDWICEEEGCPSRKLARSVAKKALNS